MRRHASVAASQEAAEARARSRHHPPPRPRLPPRPFSVRLHNPAPPRPSARLECVLAAGFLGAGLFGLLFGHGFFGGMGGLASIIGLLLQVVLVVIVARLVFAWWQRRNMQPAYAAAHP